MATPEDVTESQPEASATVYSPARLSASGIDRATVCPAAYALPVIPQTQSDDGVRGTIIHKFLELLASGIGKETALKEIEAQFESD